MTALAPSDLLDLIARAHRITSIAVDDIGDGGMSLLRWLAARHRVAMWSRAGHWHVDVNGETYTDSTLLLATLRAVAGAGE